MSKNGRIAVVSILVILACGSVPGRLASSPSRDLAVYDIYVQKDDCRLWVTFQNQGTEKIEGTFRKRITVQGTTIVIDQMQGLSLEPGAFFSCGVGADPGVIISGTKTVTATIDVDNVLAESNEANNTLTKSVNCPLHVQPGGVAAQTLKKSDLVVPYIKFAVVRSGQDAAGSYVIFNAVVYVKNVGEGGAGPFDVLLEHRPDISGPYLTCQTCKIHVPGLAAGQGLELEPRQFNKRGTPTAGQAIFFRATADIDQKINESDETNNVGKESYPNQPLHK